MTLRAVFVGPDGLRVGWRLAIFVTMLVVLFFATGPLIDFAIRSLHDPPDTLTPAGQLTVFGILLAALMLATGVMARIEGRTIGEYGLPWSRAFCGQFWRGAAISFASLTILLGLFRLGDVFSFGSLALHGTEIFKYGVVWAISFFVIVLVEDLLYRGYLLFTLTNWIGFWPAAVVTSLVMAGAHYLNPGGRALRPLFAVMVYCMVTCLVVRRTGDLWMPLGIHAAWDWGANFFYGIPSGGQLGEKHLFNPSFHGPEWITGGTFGPEGGWASIAMVALWGISFSFWLKGVKYPGPAGRAPTLPPVSPSLFESHTAASHPQQSSRSVPAGFPEP